MKIGYACQVIGILNAQQKSCIQKNATDSKLRELISSNLNVLDTIIDYNFKNGIKLFRISSDLIPFGSSQANKLNWWEEFGDEFARIGTKIKRYKMRVSMHPGQYTVLNSTNPDVVSRAVEDLRYHARVLDCLQLGQSHKIVLHIGGVYGDKISAISCFEKSFLSLPSKIKRRIVIENDDISYSISEVLDIGTRLGIPVVFDNLHNFKNPSEIKKNEVDWINTCKSTWKSEDGDQKIHYSQQDPAKRAGSHSKTIRINEFLEFFSRLSRTDLDIMLEVKDKNLSAIKCINCTTEARKITALENEWAKYKYSVLERSHKNYVEIRKILKDKEKYPAILFYNMIELTLENEITIGGAVNTAQHVWGYFKKIATKNEHDVFLKRITQLKDGNIQIHTVKNYLLKLTVKYQEKYLLESLYFD